MTHRGVLPSLFISIALISTGCPSDSKDDSANKASDAGSKGHDGSGGSRDKSDAAVDDQGRTGSQKDGGASDGKGGSNATADSGASDTPDKDAGAGGTGGSASNGSGGSGSAQLSGLCADFVKLKQDKAKELGCSSDDSEAFGRLCAISGSCMKELQAQYDCQKAATTWSCDTGDGHPQTNASCKTESDTYFGCLMTAVHNEDPFGCAAAAKTNADLAKAVGCNVDDQFENNCNQLYLRDICLDEWKAVLGCAGDKAKSDFECDADNKLQPKDGVCTAERTAFDDCKASLK